MFQKMIYRVDLVANRGVHYVFGDNEDRSGFGGQAAEMRGEPNAIGVRTKRNPMMSPNSFWSDENFAEHKKMVDEDFEKIYAVLLDGGVVVFPADGLGTGFARLDVFAPRVQEYINSRIQFCMKLKGKRP